MRNFSFIIIAKPNQSTIPALEGIQKFFDESNSSLDVVIVHGNNPSIQRNEAAKLSRGDFLIFLDNDSVLDQHYFTHFQESFDSFPDLLALGGISEIQENGNNVQQSIKLLFSSFFAIGPINSRYNSIGEMRKSTERELILCNLIIQKNIFLELSGFNHNLFPNEENEFLNRLMEKGLLIHNPRMKVFRPARDSYRLFILQMFHYGRGRSDHFKLKPRLSDLVYFFPICILIICIVFLSLGMINIFLVISLIYLMFVLIAMIVINKHVKQPKLFLYLTILFISCHLFYALGLAFGLGTIKRLKPKQAQNEISKIITFQNILELRSYILSQTKTK
jgi:hypothetical protein